MYAPGNSVVRPFFATTGCWIARSFHVTYALRIHFLTETKPSHDTGVQIIIYIILLTRTRKKESDRGFQINSKRSPFMEFPCFVKRCTENNNAIFPSTPGRSLIAVSVSSLQKNQGEYRVSEGEIFEDTVKRILCSGTSKVTCIM